MTETDPGSELAELPGELALAFLPLHKRAFGTATGLVAAFLVGAVTLFHVIVRPQPAVGLELLSQYFYGYEVSWAGALIGAAWGFFVGFVAGWFAAFCRNLAMAVMLFIGRTRAELEATRDFLDHI